MSQITWCVAYTQPMKEAVAQQHLQDQGFEAYMPRFKKIRRHARKVDEVLTPLFPRYLFVGMDLETAQWRRVNGTRGISHLLMTEDLVPARIPERVVADLRAQEEAAGVVPVSSLITFMQGDHVKVLDGAFRGQEATFERLDAQGRVQVLLAFLGREMRIALPAHAVDAA